MTLRKIQVAVGDHRGALAAADYPLEEKDSPQAFIPEEGEDGPAGPRRPNAVWLGSERALAQLGVARGGKVEREELAAIMQGRDATGGVQVRRPGSVPARDRDGAMPLDAKGEPVREAVVNSYDLTFSAPKSVSVVWSQADPALRGAIERAMFVAANGALEHVTRTRPVISGEETADGLAASMALHVTARTARGEAVPAPQLHVHSDLVGVLDRDGRLRTPDSSALYKHSAMREAGAVGRALLAEELKALGFQIEARTGRGGRYFEIAGVPKELCERMSGRSRDVEAWVREREAENGGRLENGARARGAVATRGAKSDLPPAEVRAAWDANARELKFGDEAIAELRGGAAETRALEELREELREEIVRRIWEEGPTISIGAARSIAFELAPIGLTLEQAGTLLGELKAAGELITVDGWRVTAREIRERELYVREVTRAAAAQPGAALSGAARAVGEAVAARSLGIAALDREQRDAVERLIGGEGWACLVGRAGTGKGPVLEAVAEAYREDGWRVIATALDGATTHRLGHQVSAAPVTIEQLLHRLGNGRIQVDDRTLILVEEASKVGLRHWEALAEICDRSGAKLVAIGDVEQIGAIESPGMLDVMIGDGSIPVASLQVIRRHRDPDFRHHPDPVVRLTPHPWLIEYLNGLYAGEAAEAIGVLRREGAIEMHNDRAEAMVRLVERWEQRRHEHGIEAKDTVLVVHGSNEDVDRVNALAQERRRRGGELGEQGVRAPDREYRLYVGDLVMLRDAAYQPEPGREAGERPARIENGTTGVVAGVDEHAESVEVLFDQPGGGTRLVRIDLGELRSRSEDPEGGGAVPALRLAYAGHPFPLQGGTWDYVGSLWGHWSQRKEETYSGDARARLWLDVHTDRESTGWQGEDDDRYARLAKRLKRPYHRLASITYDETPDVSLAAPTPAAEPLPWPRAEQQATATRAAGEGEAEAARQVAERLERLERIVGPLRVAGIAYSVEALEEQMAALADVELEEERQLGERALGRLDRRAALEAGRIERDRGEIESAIEDADSAASRLEVEAEERRGVGARRERQQLRQEAAARTRDSERLGRSLQRLFARDEELRVDGRHPDDWVRREGKAFARGLAAERRLTIREFDRGRGRPTPPRPLPDQSPELAPLPPEPPGVEF